MKYRFYLLGMMLVFAGDATAQVSTDHVIRGRQATAALVVPVQAGPIQEHTAPKISEAVKEPPAKVVITPVAVAPVVPIVPIAPVPQQPMEDISKKITPSSID